MSIPGSLGDLLACPHFRPPHPLCPGDGVGRAWPLFTGERAHFELAAGRRTEARRLQGALESFAGAGGLLPEQIWDVSDMPERELFFGRPSGSAMPLVWAHAEYLKLLRSLRDGQVFDMPRETVQRYLVDKTGSPCMIWRFNRKIRSVPAGKTLRIETMAPSVVHWSDDDWETAHDADTRDAGLGIHVADLATKLLPEGRGVKFTFYWPEAGRWEGTDFAITVDSTLPACAIPPAPIPG